MRKDSKFILSKCELLLSKISHFYRLLSSNSILFQHIHKKTQKKTKTIFYRGVFYFTWNLKQNIQNYPMKIFFFFHIGNIKHKKKKNLLLFFIYSLLIDCLNALFFLSLLIFERKANFVEEKEKSNLTLIFTEYLIPYSLHLSFYFTVIIFNWL